MDTGQAFSFLTAGCAVGPVAKMEALTAYQNAGERRVDLRPRMAQAYARYWGRLREFSEVEAFEKLDGSA